MSYTSLTYHIVFSTHNRKCVIHTSVERQLYLFINNFSKSQEVTIRRIGGMPDHIHILCDIPAKLAVAEYVKRLKTESSKFLSINENFPHWEKWAEGYAAFSVDISTRDAVKQYIMNQKEHHTHASLEQEFNALLAKYQIPNYASED